MKLKERINGNKQYPTLSELQNSIPSIIESCEDSGNTTNGNDDPDVPIPPKN